MHRFPVTSPSIFAAAYLRERETKGYGRGLGKQPGKKDTMPKKSAGLLLYRNTAQCVEVFLVHPGGPFWAKKDDGAWSIPKGEFAEGEEPLNAARREFLEETGFTIDGTFEPLAPVQQPGGKVVYAWAVEPTWMRPPLVVTLSPWSGRHARGTLGNSRKWIAPPGSISPERAARSSKVKSRFLTN